MHATLRFFSWINWIINIFCLYLLSFNFRFTFLISASSAILNLPAHIWIVDISISGNLAAIMIKATPGIKGAALPTRSSTANCSGQGCASPRILLGLRIKQLYIDSTFSTGVSPMPALHTFLNHTLRHRDLLAWIYELLKISSSVADLGKASHAHV